jgi:hypothetical protein
MSAPALPAALACARCGRGLAEQGDDVPQGTELRLMQLVVDSPRCSRRRLLMAFELPTYNYPARISEFVDARVVVIVLHNCLREHPPLRCKRGDMP